MNTSTDLNTLFVGRNLLEFGTLDSANSYALSLLAGPAKIPEGTVIMASEQRAGRGQAFTRWESEPGQNLLLSLILYPQFIDPSKIFLLSQTISLGVMETLKELLGEQVHIKWPNDIYYGNKKICGLLIENSIRAMHINHSVVGIGLNVNQEVFSEALPNPISVKNILGHPVDLMDVFHALCNHLEKRYLQLKSGQAKEIKADYLNSLYRYNESHTFEYGGQKFKAKIIDVADDGKLMLEYGKGLTGSYDFKTIHFVLNEEN